MQLEAHGCLTEVLKNYQMTNFQGNDAGISFDASQVEIQTIENAGLFVFDEDLTQFTKLEDGEVEYRLLQ